MNDTIKTWLKAAGVRALKTAAQAAVATIGAATMLSEVSWELVVSASVLAAVMSLLTSVAGIPEVDNGASLFALERADYVTDEEDETDED